jgi:hypothetical protein
MIERGRTPTHQPKVFSLMLEVTAGTIIDFVTVKASASAHALGEVFVTGKAPVRFDTPSRRVAGHTIR